MEERYKMGNEDAKPNTTIYSSAITAWANIQDSNAGMRAEALLKRMDEPYRMGNKGVKPNTLSQSSAINVWAKKQSLKRCNASRSHSSANGRTILKLGNAYVELNTVSCSSGYFCAGNESTSKCCPLPRPLDILATGAG
jgi:hypothetical protein